MYAQCTIWMSALPGQLMVLGEQDACGGCDLTSCMPNQTLPLWSLKAGTDIWENCDCEEEMNLACYYTKR